MPISIDIDVEVSKDASGAIRRAQRSRLQDAMARGFAESQELVPEDRGTLRMSGFKPTWDGDSIRYGYQSRHAGPMEYGTEAYWAPIQPLKEWADRVVGDPSFGYYVQWKIAQEGIEAHPFLRPSADSVKQWLQNNTFGEYLEREL